MEPLGQEPGYENVPDIARPARHKHLRHQLSPRRHRLRDSKTSIFNQWRSASRTRNLFSCVKLLPTSYLSLYRRPHRSDQQEYRMKKAILFGSKAVISAALFWFVLRHIDVAHDFEQIQRASAALLIAATLLCVIAVCLQAWRWQLILEIGGKTYALTRLISHTFTGMFFNQALPSSVGGDAIRVWLILRDGAPPSLAIRSVLIERGLGLLG